MKQQTPLEKYRQDLESDGFEFDAAQENAIMHLQRLYDELLLESAQGSKRPWYKRILKAEQKKVVKGLYFWGGVGRGKTYLMDIFYECLPMDKKLRIHFHRFMHRVHDELKLLKNVENPLITVAEKIALETKIICFDEFFVSDITDAMLLGGLFEQLFDRGIILVATSNIAPERLYWNGLQRVRFLPTIALLQEFTEIVNVDSGIDYRLRTLSQAEIYHHPLDIQADLNLNRYFEQLACEPMSEGIEISVNDRPLDVRREADGVALFDFSVLCESARSQADYMELSRIYNTILLSNVKVMGQQNDDAARRFIALVDEFYERNVKLIISAEVPMDSLYQGGILNFEFKRCLSRLQEMQSQEYLAKAHLP